MLLSPPLLTSGLNPDPESHVPFDRGRWLTADDAGDGLLYDIEPGSLPRIRWFTCDLLTDQPTDLVLNLEFYEPGDDRPFMCRFTLLPNVQARLRFDTQALNFNRWRYHREGGCLKPTIGGRHVDPLRVDRIVLKVLYKAPGPARWCMTPLEARAEEPPVLADPVIAAAPLLDELGQATFREWPGRTGAPEELATRLREQLAAAGNQDGNTRRSRWGGWLEKKVEASGFFRTHHDGGRWWLVDPSGCLFWSVGPDCVRPQIESNIRLIHDALAWMPPHDGEYAECYVSSEDAGDENESCDFLIANFIRVFGADWRERWSEIVYPLLHRIGFNSCGNWSDTEAARAAGMPYVYPMPGLPPSQRLVQRVFRDFPDVFDREFAREADHFANSLRPLSEDPAMIGYFLMNEPEWGFARMLVAEGMIRNSGDCATRRAFVDFLRARYGDDAALSSAWGMETRFVEIAVPWAKSLTASALTDLRAFSTIMVRELYEKLSAACRRADPHHLNLGARFANVPEDWVVDAMSGFDVFSINCYQLQADQKLASICERLHVPALIGEWHFGAIDAGLPAAGIMHAASQLERGHSYRYFVEQSAAQPWCVGAHWFTLYDQSALGRFDGENYNIGFLDVCHRPYDELVGAARTTHERLYDIAAGKVMPSSQVPAILPHLNM